MIAYNRLWLENAALQQEVTAAFHQQCINGEEKTNIEAAYPVGFYTPGPYIRIGLFLLTVTIVLFSLGLLLLITGADNTWRGVTIITGLAAYGALELFVRDKKHYRSGVDDGLLWVSAALLLAALNIELDLPMWLRCLLIFVIAVYATLRFTDKLMSAVAVLSLLACLFYIYLLLGNIAKVTAPFLMMGASLLLYWLTGRLGSQPKWRLYTHCCTMAAITALITLYLAGNYFVVRAVSNEMFGLNLEPWQGIPLGWLFWAYTILLPFVYIYYGIRRKDVIRLRIGLVLVAVVILTVRQYYNLMALEVEITIYGIAMIAIAVGLIRYLRTPRYGFTHKEDDLTHLVEKLQAESLIITETYDPPPAPAPGFKFGGGTGSGGGADGSW